MTSGEEIRGTYTDDVRFVKNGDKFHFCSSLYKSASYGGAKLSSGRVGFMKLLFHEANISANRRSHCSATRFTS